MVRHLHFKLQLIRQLNLSSLLQPLRVYRLLEPPGRVKSLKFSGSHPITGRVRVK